MGDYVTQTGFEQCFWCYSSDAGFEYLVEVSEEENVQRAMEIAREQLKVWCSCENEDDPRYNMGFVEVVKVALDEAGIEAKYYANAYE